MAVDGTLKLAVSATGVEAGSKKAKRSLEEVQKSAKDTAKALQKASIDAEQETKRAAKSAADEVKKQNKKIDDANKRSIERKREFVSQINAVKVALAGYVSLRTLSTLTDLAKQQDRINSLFRTGFGDAKRIKDELGFVQSVSQSLGLVINDTAMEYGRFAAAVKGTSLEGEQARKIFLSVSKAASAMALSGDDVNGVFRALQQMVSKGNVQAEELRGQLGERLPGAFNMAAKAMGVTTQQLNKMLEQGQVMAVDLLPKLAEEMDKAFGENAQKNASNTQAQINKVTNAFQALGKQIVDMGFIGMIGDIAQKSVAFAEAMKEGLKVYERLLSKGTAQKPSQSRIGTDYFSAYSDSQSLTRRGAGGIFQNMPKDVARGQKILAGIVLEFENFDLSRIAEMQDSQLQNIVKTIDLMQQNRQSTRNIDMLQQIITQAQLNRSLGGGLTAEQANLRMGMGFQLTPWDADQRKEFLQAGTRKQVKALGAPMQSQRLSDMQTQMQVLSGFGQTTGLDLLSSLEIVPKAMDKLEKEEKKAMDAFSRDIGESFMDGFGEASQAVYDFIFDSKMQLTDLQNAARGWASQFGDTLTDAFMTGKFAFSDLVNSILRDLMRLQIQKSIVTPLMDMFPSIFGSHEQRLFSSKASGGIVGTGGSAGFLPASAWAGAPAFAAGGVVPGHGAVPVIAHAGELILNQAQQKAIGSTTVNIIDQRGSGSPVQVEERSQNGQKVIDITIKDSFRAGLVKGDFDREFASIYGMKRRGR